MPPSGTSSCRPARRRPGFPQPWPRRRGRGTVPTAKEARQFPRTTLRSDLLHGSSSLTGEATRCGVHLPPPCPPVEDFHDHRADPPPGWWIHPFGRVRASGREQEGLRPVIHTPPLNAVEFPSAHPGSTKRQPHGDIKKSEARDWPNSHDWKKKRGRAWFSAKVIPPRRSGPREREEVTGWRPHPVRPARGARSEQPPDLFRRQHLAGRDDLFVHDEARRRHHPVGGDLGEIGHLDDLRVLARRLGRRLRVLASATHFLQPDPRILMIMMHSSFR